MEFFRFCECRYQWVWVSGGMDGYLLHPLARNDEFHPGRCVDGRNMSFIRVASAVDDARGDHFDLREFFEFRYYQGGSISEGGV